MKNILFRVFLILLVLIPVSKTKSEDDLYNKSDLTLSFWGAKYTRKDTPFLKMTLVQIPSNETYFYTGDFYNYINDKIHNLDASTSGSAIIIISLIKFDLADVLRQSHPDFIKLEFPKIKSEMKFGYRNYTTTP